MKEIIVKILKLIKELKYRHLFYGSLVRVHSSSKFCIGKNTKIKRSRLYISANSQFVLGDNSIIYGANIHLMGQITFGKGTIIEKGYTLKNLNWKINGKINAGDYNRLRSTIWLRYGGQLSIGNYTNINEETELRIDESIDIGSFNQISYKCIIWDTNTHNIYLFDKRRKMTIEKYPVFGFEYEKPKTKKVVIGDDCWIGREVAILKGVTIGDKCIVGYRTILSNCLIDDNTTVHPEINNKMNKSNYTLFN